MSLLAGMAAACSSDVSRFNDPNATSIASNAPPAYTGSVSPAAPSSAVQSAPIAAPAPVASSAPYGAPAQPYGAPAQQTHYAAAPAPAAQPIYGSRPQAAAPAPAPTPTRTAAAATGGAHVVTSGETLSSISRLYGVSRSVLAQANGLDINASVRIGQRLVIPGASGGAVIAAAPKAAQPAPVQPAPAQQALGKPAAPTTAVATAPVPAKQPATKPVDTKTAATTKPVEAKPLAAAPAPLAEPKTETIAAVKPAESSVEVRDADAGVQFRWPVRGRVISGFGPKPGGQQNEGINVSVPEGTSVKAAEDGVVAYAGNELKGYGNLVLIKHADGWVTAYAHNSAIDVKKGDKVKRGQTIAKAGQTGSVSSPQVHFEIRKGSQAVDPSQHLAGL
ncbi:M23 family metallopeptidase [Bosea sp. 117]|uniref:M23 family metallopeptidase n=1 Tax=Bosea sp. 117 TaxID=1125973 RepID=UPI0020C16315|nr:M23 family metallopeptidase [Bosea sp. 117]